MKHKYNRIVLFIILLTLCNSVQAQIWRLKYGDSKGKIAVFNKKTAKDFAEDAPFGPMAFRIVNNKLWLLDSCAGNLNQYGNNNRLLQSFQVATSGFKLLEDFCFATHTTEKPEIAWIANAVNCRIYKVSLKNGKKLLTIGSHSEKTGTFLQINQLETDADGNLYVGDYGRSTISIFNIQGVHLGEIPWQLSGFAIDNIGQLHILHYEDNVGYSRRVYTKTGQLLKNYHIGLNHLQDPRVWRINSSSDMLVSFVPKGGFKGKLEMFKIKQNSKVISLFKFVPPASMNRFIEMVNETFFLAKADFFKAPKGTFSINKIAKETSKND